MELTTENKFGMIWRSKKTLIFAVFLTLFIISFPKLYFIGQEAVLSKLPHLDEPTSPQPISTPPLQIPAPITTVNYPVNILLLAYHRTGSSLTGELLSLLPNSAYFFEPIFYPTITLRDWSSESRIQTLLGLFECNINLLHAISIKSSVHIIRKLNGDTIRYRDGLSSSDLMDGCLISRVRIAKTIRLRMDDIRYIMDEIEEPNFKIIHLVRDPRAMLNSVQQSRIWKEEDQTPVNTCNELSQEVELGNQMPENIYLRIRYEDIVENPNETAYKMYNFIGHKIDDKMLEKYLKTHMHAELNSKSNKFAGEFFNTIRNSSYKVNHWINEVSNEFIKQVETACEWVMEELGYQKFDLMRLNESKN